MTHLFQGISNKNKEKLLYSLEANSFTFDRNKRILTTVKSDDIIGFIEYGKIQIIRNDFNGNVTIIDELQNEEIFGTMLYTLNNDEYDIITKEETKLIIIDYERIINEEINKPNYYNQFIKNLLNIITDKIEEKNERIEILTKKSIRDKLLEYFKILAKKRGFKVIYLPLTFTELADYLAVDRSAMSRELKNLKEEGFIKTDKKKITLLY